MPLVRRHLDIDAPRQIDGRCSTHRWREWLEALLSDHVSQQFPLGPRYPPVGSSPPGVPGGSAPERLSISQGSEGSPNTTLCWRGRLRATARLLDRTCVERLQRHQHRDRPGRCCDSPLPASANHQYSSRKVRIDGVAGDSDARPRPGPPDNFGLLDARRHVKRASST